MRRLQLKGLVPGGVGVAIVVMAVLVGACIPSSPQASNASASTPPATDAPSTTAPNATPGPVTDTLTGGRYLFRPLAEMPTLTIVATGPAGWRGFPSYAMDGPDPVGIGAPSGIGIAFLSADGVYSDPCHWDLLGNGVEGQPSDVVVGPAVDDLVAALRANTFYTSSAATPVTIDGYAGRELEIQLPDDSFTTCDKTPGDADGHAFVFSGKAGLYVYGPANRWHIFIVDVEGTRLLAVVFLYEGTPQADVDLAQSIVDTMDINP